MTQRFDSNLLKLPSTSFPGKLIVVEGPDGSGRSTQISMLVPWLEQQGHWVVNMRLKGSTLIAEELSAAQQGNYLSHTTMSLFYATDFADQLENIIIPGLIGGAVVICDRYIYTLIARDLARGGHRDWIENVYRFALKPDIVFYLQLDAHSLMNRTLEKNLQLNYWESGMDIGLSDSIFDCFLKYQDLMLKQFMEMAKVYDFNVIDGNQPKSAIFSALKSKIAPLLA